MESLQWARRQCRQVLSSEAGLGWYLPADSPASKNGPAYSDSAAYKPGGKRRTVIAHHGPYQDEYYSISKGYQGNRIRTTKYTLLSFIPMNLFEQFHRTANLYFLFLVLLNWVPVVEAFQKEITMIPLVVVLGVIAFKDALEDYRRYCFDKMINNNVTKVYCGKQRRYVDKHWKDVCVGDFVRLACNEIIPADMVLLQSSDPDGVCHIETSNLDGETNLKQRQVVKGLAEQGSDVIPEKFDSRIECESPNNDLSRFRGFLENPRWGTRVGLRSENLLLRSCAIRNTEAVIGIVVYAGHETKAMKNNSGPRYKRSKLERRLNIDVLWSVVLLLVMCLAAAVGHGLWLSGLRNPPFIVPDGTSPALAGFYLFWTMIIVLQVLIPISLYVSIEIVKLGQVYFIQNDVDFHEGRLASGVQCRALNITEDLGQVQYVFSDKTGTLTENKMVFCRCSIAGVEYPHEDNARRLELYHHQDWDDDDDDDDDDNSHPTMKAKSRSSLRSLSCRSMDCNRSSISLHTLTDCDPAAEDQVEALDGGGRRQVAFSSRMEKDVIPDPRLIQKLNQLSSPKLSGEIGDTSQEIPYIVDFFLAIALCNTVVVSSPNQQQKTACLIPEVPRKPLRSLEDMKQLFQRFGVPRIGSFSSTGEKMSQTSDSSASFTQRIFFRTKGSRPSLTMPKVDEEDGEESQVRASTPTQTEVVGAAEVEPLQQAELCGDACLVQGELEELMYEAESPDEAALVHAARAYRCILRARTSEQLVVDLPGLGHLSVPVLHVLPFDSLRKRMSVVVRHPLTGQVVVYTKGADSAIMDLTASPTDDCPNAGCQRRIKEQTQRHLDDYAREGLRTLCIATKVLEEEDYAMWLKTYTFAETSIENREELLLESVKELEKDLTLLGATGIVDRLQEEVPETIEALQMAGMKVWVLTGDKQETAVNVACSCKLLRPSDKLLTANCDSKEACETLLADLWSAIIEEESGGAVTGFTLVIDGRTLELALQAGLEDTFLRLAGCCRAVICCRSTPLQKSQVVRLVRDKLGVLTLAIGDGANDVSMIQTADVGIGISGQEGMQAVMSSDFAISRFRHLRKLLLVHGHWCYTRLAKMTLYFFYKNIAYVNLLFWYQFFCGFSGSTMSNYWILIFFNLLFTSAPPLLYGILDKDVSADTLLQLPLLYQAGQNSQAYLPSTFWCTVLDALYQSLACFLIPYFTYADSDISVFSFGTPLNTSALLIILLHLVIESQTLTWMHSTVLLGSAVFYCAFVLVFSVTCVTCNSPSNPLGVDVRHMSDPLFYCVCILTTVVALLPRILYRSICNSICPSDLLKAAQLDRQNPEERRMKIQLWRSSQASSKPLYLNMEFDATRQHDTPPGLRHLLIPEET